MRRPFSLAVLAALLLTLLLAAPANAGPDPKPEGAPAAPADPSSTEAEEAVLSGLTQIDAGYDLSCGRTTTGQVRCWGENDIGQLGQGDRNPRTFAVTVKNAAGNGPLTGVVQVAVGDDHACALLTSGEVRCWGDNSDFELGSGFISNDKTRPVPVVGLNGTGRLRNVVAIGAESDGACALLSNREVRCWGDDDYGQLGNGNPLTDSNKPVVVKGTGGTGRLGNVTQIDPGYDNACARLANGQARCWGYNSEGQLGNNTTTGSPFPVVVKNLGGGGPLTGVTQVAIGGYVGCARLANGQARCWGDNTEGSVGDGTTTERLLPVVVKNPAGTGPLTGVVEIYTGTDHACARVNGGQARCWGSTDDGQVGDGTPLNGPDRLLPRAVRNLGNTGNLTGIVRLRTNQDHTCVIVGGGQARCWGRNPYGQLGNGGTVDKSLPVAVRT